MLVADFDNYDGELTDEDCEKLITAGVGGGLVGLQYPGAGYPSGVAHQQIPMLVRHGLVIVGAYQMSTSIDIAWQHVSHLAHLIPQVYVDVEIQGITKDYIDSQLNYIDALRLQFRGGIYSRKDFWNNQQYAHWFGDRDYWAAQYDENYDIETYDTTGDWPVARIKQVTGTAHVGRLNLDLNVMR